MSIVVAFTRVGYMECFTWHIAIHCIEPKHGILLQDHKAAKNTTPLLHASSLKRVAVQRASS